MGSPCSIVRLTLAAVTLAAALALPRRARAQGDEANPNAPTILSWVAPPGCPSEAELTRQILGAIGAGANVPASLHARAVVEEASGRWRAEVELSIAGDASIRRVEGETCRAVADAVAVIIAVAVTPEVTPPAPPPPEPAPAPPLPAPQAPPPASPLAPFTLAAMFLLDDGTLPTVGYGPEVVGGWRRSRLELEVAARFLAPETGDLSNTNKQGAHFWMLGGGLRACYAVLTRTLDVAPCAGVHGEWLVANGFGTNNGTQSPAAGTGVLSLGARAGLRISARWSLRMGVEADAPLVRTLYQILNGGTVYRRSAVAGRATLGPLLAF